MIRNYRNIGASQSYLQGLASGMSQAGKVSVIKTGLLMHGDGENLGTVFIDERGHTVRKFGDVYTSTLNPKFGDASIYIRGGTNCYLEYPPDDDWTFGISPFTIDLWFKYHPNQPVAGSTRINLLSSSSLWSHPTTNQRVWGMEIEGGGRIRVSSYHYLNGITTNLVENRSFLLQWNLDEWYHIAWVVSGWNSQNIFSKIFRNGMELTIDTATQSNYIYHQYSGGTFPNTEEKLAIGHIGQYSFPASVNLDEIRIVKGKAMWSSDFTPPTQPYE